MNQLFTKLKDPFIKEVRLAIVLFCLPFLMWVHVLFNDETASVFSIFGVRHDHGYGADQVFAWVMLSYFTTIIYLVLLFSMSKERFRFIVLFLIAWLYFFFTEDILLGFVPLPKLFLLSVAVMTTCLFLYRLLKKDVVHWSTVGFVKTKVYSKKKLSYFIILLLACFFCTLHEIIPGLDAKILAFGPFQIESYGFPSVMGLLWFLSFKVAILVPMMVWFLTEKKWWKYALLSPILITTYQIRSIFFVTDVIDEYEIFQALPLLGLLTIVLIALSKNAKDQYLFKAIYNSTYTRAEKTVKNRFKKKQLELDKAKETLECYKEKSNEASLAELKALKERLEKKLSR